MPTGKQASTKKPASRPKKKAGLPRSERAKLSALLAIFEEQLQSTRDSRISVGDYIRLLQMKRDIDQKKPKSVEVKWVDKPGEENASDK